MADEDKQNEADAAAAEESQNGESVENVNELLDTTGPTIESLTDLLRQRDAEISALKAANYDLITGGVSAPVVEEAAEEVGDEPDPEDAPEVTEDDLF